MHTDGPARLLADIAAEVALSHHLTGRAALDERVMHAMARVPRDQFLPDALRYLAFRDGPVPIGHDQTLSQPFIVALMTDLLDLPPHARVLEVGTGSGYQAAVLAELAGAVYSVEIIPDLADAAAARLARLGYANVTARQGDGYAGWPEHAPYDGILVTAAAPHVPPALREQLRPGARLVIPVGPAGGHQTLRVVEKRPDGGCTERDVLDVAFVPLTGACRDAVP